MRFSKRLRTTLGAATLSFVALFGQSAWATTVQFQTVMGDFEVNLYDETTPETVANFLRYIEDDAYELTFFHRSVPDFVIQGGGYVYDEEEDEPVAVKTYDPVVNEPKWSNRRGTIAMAKRGNEESSATSQWFINLAHNHENLDRQSGGFTVFGEVVGDGMKVVDAIAELDRFRFRGAFDNLPLRDFGEDEIEEEIIPNLDHLVIVHNILVLDAATDTAADLNPVPNTLINEPPPSSSSSSGNASWAMLLLLLGLGAGRRLKLLR